MIRISHTRPYRNPYRNPSIQTGTSKLNFPKRIFGTIKGYNDYMTNDDTKIIYYNDFIDFT